MNRVSLGILLLLKINNIFSVNITCLKIIIKHKKNTPTVFYYLANNTDGNTILSNGFKDTKDDNPGFALTIEGVSGSVFTSNQILKFIMSNSKSIFSVATRLPLEECLKYDYSSYDFDVNEIKVINATKLHPTIYTRDNLFNIVLSDNNIIYVYCYLKEKSTNPRPSQSKQPKSKKCC